MGGAGVAVEAQGRVMRSLRRERSSRGGGGEEEEKEGLVCRLSGMFRGTCCVFTCPVL